jgi:hypothetical protein
MPNAHLDRQRLEAHHAVFLHQLDHRSIQLLHLFAPWARLQTVEKVAEFPSFGVVFEVKGCAVSLYSANPSVRTAELTELSICG